LPRLSGWVDRARDHLPSRRRSGGLKLEVIVITTACTINSYRRESVRPAWCMASDKRAETHCGSGPLGHTCFGSSDADAKEAAQHRLRRQLNIECANQILVERVLGTWAATSGSLSSREASKRPDPQLGLSCTARAAGKPREPPTQIQFCSPTPRPARRGKTTIGLRAASPSPRWQGRPPYLDVCCMAPPPEGRQTARSRAKAWRDDSKAQRAATTRQARAHTIRGKRNRDFLSGGVHASLDDGTERPRLP
jgi:hypothetical protein